MKSIYLQGILLFSLFLMDNYGFAQTTGIQSGSVYTLKSKTHNKLLNVSDASMDNGAAINTWNDTKSDAQRWIVKLVDKDLYTLTNVASGKLLHSAAISADSIPLVQTENVNNENIKFSIKKLGGEIYCSKAPNLNDALNILSIGVDAININLTNFTNSDAQKWVFQKTNAQPLAPTAAIAEKVFDAWYAQYQIETFKGFWDRAEMMEILLDSYEVTKDRKYLTKFGAMYENFLSQHTGDWMYNKFNDDIAWAAI
ncbi:MAG: RICIN domain-containing protein, partial [Pedobacter sp.]|nr:RICIN domain-containing protein [Pedobacter sp.]